MRIAVEIVLLIAGFFLMIKGADVFVGASVDIAKRLRIPTVIIGLTIVALGTSAPEAVVSVTAAIGGSSELAIGNVVGSNIFNLLFIVGFCALLRPVYVNLKEITKDFWVSFGAAALLLVMMLIFTSAIPRLGGLILFACFLVYMTVLVRKALSSRTENKAAEENIKENTTPQRSLTKTIILTILGIGLIISGGQATVWGAVNIAARFGVTERVIGLTILALGTSLPEFVTTIVACRKGESEIAIGNIIGSNIFNILFVLGLSGMILPLAVDRSLIFDMAVLTVGSLAFLLFALSGKRVVRFEGFSMVSMYAAYMLMLFV
ncbi:MAG: calcium/sodium antiporter [Oscillospiraceae bacterium]|nr:calcium/sodium antiporter [Oscillospiraceae bacterium]